ncbi:heat shock factor protein 1 isoform X2 [Triplophysa dalaica]|uniref:heat shock factor protein 1 isoform X2 n=1 Tax=Triplophysa dalaica TaxID=1582913 RepID=UPI0024DF97A2|nr:heat shock factor protein 1 isoform X2 [Triplophysa dalaica]
MEYHSVGPGGVMVAGNNVPAFLTKLWTLVEDPDTDPLICWSPNGTSFHVFDQGRFSKDVLPKYFKHNNMASFVRQLNMYGFRKVVHIEQGGLVKPEKDDTEFQHPYFIRGQEHLLENIKRKVTTVSNIKQEDLKISSDNVSKMITDFQLMKGKQESMDSRISALKHENESLWREVASLRQKHSQQQKVVNKLIQFLITLARSNRVLGVKRKIPLMLNDSSSTHSLPKYARQYSLESSPSLSPSSTAFTGTGVFASETSVNTGPIISDITELAQSNSVANEDWIEDRTSPVVHIKEEPSSPTHSPEVEEVCPVEVEVEAASSIPVYRPISPMTFINSILQESEPVTSQSPPHAEQKCLSVACLDKSELSDHLESIDYGLENLQHILNAQSINFDGSPLFDIFASSAAEVDLDSLASIQDLLSPDPVKESESTSDSCDSGKQLVQYTAQPVILPDPVTTTDTSGNDLPILLELEGDTYFEPEPTEDPTISLLNFSTSPAPQDPKL